MIEVEFFNMTELKTEANDGNCDGGEYGIKDSCFAT